MKVGLQIPSFTWPGAPETIGQILARIVRDADGRIMRSTVRAVADELASTAELVLGKTAGRPLALVRGAAFRRGEGRIADALLPAEMDLFR